MNKTKRYFLAFITALIFAVAPVSSAFAGYSSSRSFSSGSSSKSYSSPSPKPSYSAPKPSAPAPKPSYSAPKPSQKPSYSSPNATKPKPQYAKPKPSTIPPNTTLTKNKKGQYVTVPKSATRFGSGRGSSYRPPSKLVYRSPNPPRGISRSEWNRMPYGAYHNLNSPVYWANPASPWYYLFLAQYGSTYNTPQIVQAQKRDKGGLGAGAIIAIVLGGTALAGGLGYGLYKLTQ